VIPGHGRGFAFIFSAVEMNNKFREPKNLNKRNMGLGNGIKIARSTLAYLAMSDELTKRMDLACGKVRELGSASKSGDTSIKNQKKVDDIDSSFKDLNEAGNNVRELEILAGRLVKLCADIIEDNTKSRS
jgi:hypothetical protein